MPIYEFYCRKCHTIYNFFSKRIDTKSCPKCPKCKRTKLERQVSLFSSAGSSEDTGEADAMPFDERKMESALGHLASEAERINDDDPKAAANLMRKFSNMTGVEFGGSMEEALRRLEKGENPDEIEKDLGDVMQSGDQDFIISKKPGAKKNQRPPAVDHTLHEM